MNSVFVALILCIASTIPTGPMVDIAQAGREHGYRISRLTAKETAWAEKAWAQ